jgi:transcriptional regulator GlxA family with amidase domain
MQRREFLGNTVKMAAAGALIAGGSQWANAEKNISTGKKLTPPADGSIKVAFVLTEGANVIDTFGPWEVFQDAMLHEGGNMQHPFKLGTVGESREPVRMTGGVRVVPDFTFDDSPQPQVVVVPAQRGSKRTHEWLRQVSKKNDVTMSVCTGAFQLARAGLLEGLPATTHHEYWDAFAREFPKIELKRGLRFVDNGRIATAGGLTSGVDLALHIVERYYGRDVARATAVYMEYTSEAWAA